MGTSRASNKDILDAINALTSAITATHVAAPAPVIAAPVQAAPTGEATVNVDAKYMAHMASKVDAMVKADGQSRILYTRRNGYGEVKLAYTLASNWTTLKDRGLIGAVKVVSA